MSNERRLFKGMSATNWMNLAIAALLVFYMAQIAADIAWGNLFGHFGSDFASFWSAGFIANHEGYAAVYNLDLMAGVQHPLLPTVQSSAYVFHPIPTPYLPLFIVPFQLLALVPPAPAAYTWEILNGLGTFAYLWFFSTKLRPHAGRGRVVLLSMVSAPVFLNLFTGQTNLLLLICVGEFTRAAIAGQALKSGLWLGGLMLKPQCLILIAPALLMQRSFRSLIGLGMSSAAIAGVSLALGGAESIRKLVQLWLGYASGLPTNDVGLMMNWRMLGFHLAGVVGPHPAWIIAFSGLIATAVAGLALWIHPIKTNSVGFTVSLTGILAATGAIAWHSHVTMAMMLLPPLLILYLTQRAALDEVMEWWVFLPASLYFLRLVLASLIHAGTLPGQMSGFLDFLGGIGLFGLNLYLLAWALRTSRKILAAGTIPERA